MTCHAAPPILENDSDFRPSRAVCCLQIQVMPLNLPRIRLLITCSFPFRRDSHSGRHPSSISPRQRVTAGSEDAQCGQSAFTENVRHNCPPASCHT